MKSDRTAEVIARAKRKADEVQTRKVSQGRIYENVNSPFDKGSRGGKRCRRKKQEGSTFDELSSWAEHSLREAGSIRDRTLMALRDAGRMAASKVASPFEREFYISPTIVKGWKLTPLQLFRGLERLAADGCIRFVERKRGKYARVILLQKPPCDKAANKPSLAEEEAPYVGRKKSRTG